MRSLIARFAAVHRMLAAVVLIVAATSAAACRNSAVEPDSAPWARHVQVMDNALGRGDGSAAIRAWNAAYVTALESSRWEGLVAVGDASLSDAIADMGAITGHGAKIHEEHAVLRLTLAVAGYPTPNPRAMKLATNTISTTSASSTWFTR